MSNSIIFEEQNETGIVLLNKPKALNALDLEMAELFYDKLNDWKNNKNIKRILIKGEGKAFCAGGDVKSVFLSSNISNLKKKFFYKEYKLNFAISEFDKNYLSIWNGIVMGGGVGLSIYGNARITTENSKFAMPETAIGFFPDVGGSYFLSRMPKNVGVYLGLTGKIITSYEMMFFGISTHFYNSKNIKNVEMNYINNGTLPPNDKVEEKDSDIINNIDFIYETFEGNIFSIIEKIKNSNSDFAKKTYENILTRCPMSLAVSAELFSRAKKLSLKECLEMEFQLSQKIVYREDFNNGVEAVLITKTYHPKWSPNSINAINKNDIDKLFVDHAEKLKL